MRFATTALFSISLFLCPVISDQLHFNSTPVPHSTTIIDVLSQDEDYTSLLKLLQRALLIPTLNKLNHTTLFAPTNDAIERHSFWRASLTDQWDLLDNRQEKLRQELYYHMLNYSISEPLESNLEVLKTLHFPRRAMEPPTHEPAPQPPWLPRPGGSLGGEPQRLRISYESGAVHVGVDARGKGGAAVVKGEVHAGNGVVAGIDDVLDVPKDLATTLKTLPSLSYLSSIIQESALERLSEGSNLTVFLPVNTAWDSLDSLEKRYLESPFSKNDVNRIVDMHTVVDDGVYWSDSFERGQNLTTQYGSSLEITVSPESGKMIISSSEIVNPDVYASNGVLHTVSSLLIPQGALMRTAEKYLLTLNCTGFVEMLHSVDLESMINSTESEYTILAPADDVLKLFGGDNSGLPEKGTAELRRFLSYHFIPGKWTPDQFKDGSLVPTALQEVGLDGENQVLHVEVTPQKGSEEYKSIRFGGVAGVIDYYELPHTIIYLLSRPLELPEDPLETAVPIVGSSSFLVAIFSTSISDYLKIAPKTTFLIPLDEAFTSLGLLVRAHLLARSSRTDLESIIKHHIVKGVEYSKSIRKGSQQTFPTLEGSDLRIDRTKNGTVTVSSSGGWPGMSGDITTLDILTKTGVLHQVSGVLIPKSVNITMGKLMKAAKGSIMVNMISKVGMEWMLNGTAPPEGSPWAEAGHGTSWTLLCPSDDAFKGFNLTKFYEDTEELKSIVYQHIVPSPEPVKTPKSLAGGANVNMPLQIQDGATYTTLQSAASAYGDLVFRNSTDKERQDGIDYLVGIKDARGTEGQQDWARVVSWGRSTTGGGLGGVIQIDQLLVPYKPKWYIKYAAPIGVGVLGVAVIGVFFLGVRKFWRRDNSEATYEPVGGFGQIGEDEEDS